MLNQILLPRFRRVRGIIKISVLLFIFQGCSNTSREVTIPGVQASLGKVIVKRGGPLQLDVERLIVGGYTPIGSTTYSASTFAAAANVGRESGLNIGAHLVTIYDGMKAQELSDLRYPITLTPRGLNVTPSQVLRRIKHGEKIAIFWAKPTRSPPFGAYVFEDAILESVPEELGVNKGLRIAFIVRRSPALFGGLQAGDIIVDINGQPLTGGPEQFLTQVGALRDQFPLFHYYREGEIHEAEVDISP